MYHISKKPISNVSRPSTCHACGRTYLPIRPISAEHSHTDILVAIFHQLKGHGFYVVKWRRLLPRDTQARACHAENNNGRPLQTSFPDPKQLLMQNEEVLHTKTAIWIVCTKFRHTFAAGCIMAPPLRRYYKQNCAPWAPCLLQRQTQYVNRTLIMLLSLCIKIRKTLNNDRS